MLRALSILLAVWLTGCASTPGGLMANENSRRAFTVDAPYQLAFKRIVETSKECYVIASPFGQGVAESNLYADLKMGTVSIGASSAFGRTIYVQAEVKELTPTRSEVVMFSKGNRDGHYARLSRWAAGDLRCDA